MIMFVGLSASGVVLRRVRLVAGVAALAAGVAGCGSGGSKQAGRPERGAFPCTPSYVHDGDTFRCTDGTRIRVAGINAREIAHEGAETHDNGCNPGAPCPQVDAVAAREKLVRLLGTPGAIDDYGNEHVSGPPLSCDPNGMSYDRIAAFCFTGSGTDISCAMVAGGAAATWPRYWKDHRC
ncbi:MAG TPA: thermonuclease family protein [Allosphingosinicella sp.]